MKMRYFTALAGLLALIATSASAQDRTFLNQYCVTCHNEKTKTAGLMLDKLDVDHPGDNAETWEKVVRKLRAGMMPPSGEKLPDAETTQQLVAYLEDRLDAAAAAHPSPGRKSLHRLNRTEYRNAVRDLIGLQIDAKSLLSPDEADQEGFDNVASVLSVSPALLEAYLYAARSISRLAVGDPTINPVSDVFKIPTALVQDERCLGVCCACSSLCCSLSRSTRHHGPCHRLGASPPSQRRRRSLQSSSAPTKALDIYSSRALRISTRLACSRFFFSSPS